MRNYRKCIDISMLCALVTASAMVYSLQIIFFPAAAESKGANAFEYGFVFSVYQLAALFATPILASHIHHFNIKPVILFGMVLDGCATILFGFMSELNSFWGFMLGCSFLRIFEAIGASCTILSCYILVTKQFPNSIATYMGVLQSAFKIGGGIGPAIGAPLFQLGGFKTPFLTVGGFLLLLTFLPLYVLPKEVRKDGVVGSRPRFGFLRLLTSLPLLFISLINVTRSAGLLFVFVSLEPQLRTKVEMTTVEVGLTFMLLTAVFAVSTPLWGVLADRMAYPGFLSLIGLLFLAVSTLLIGPATFLPLKLNVAWIVIVVVIMGLGQGAITVASFLQMLNEAKRSGFDDELSRNGLVSSLHLASSSLGAFIGPTLGGLLVTLLGFRTASEVFSGIYALLLVVSAMYLTHKTTENNQQKICQIEMTEKKLKKECLRTSPTDE